MGINTTRVVKFIRKGEKGEKGDDAVRFWLIPSVSSVSMTDVRDGSGTPVPAAVTCRLVKQIGEDSPVTITDAAAAGLAISYALIQTDTDTAPTPTAYDGGSVSVPSDVSYRAIEFYLYRGSQLIDTATVAIVCDGEAGQDGMDAIAIRLSPHTVVLRRGHEQSAKVYVDFFKGETVVPYEDPAQGNLTCSVLTSDSDHIITEGLKWSFGGDDGRFYYRLLYDGSTDINTEVPFTITYNGKTYPEKIVVSTVADGDRGPTLRGPQAWSDCGIGYNFQSGATGEAYKDVVLYQDNYYSCVKSHTKTVGNYPGSPADRLGHYWRLGDKIELVATKILLATYALVKNLGVESIDMKDEDGNILFQAKDGNVICRTGAFDNITVTNATIESGQIAGFKVSGTGLTNEPFTNDAYVIFSNEARKCFAGIGGNINPAYSGARAVARFENEDTTDQWGKGRNIAMLLSAKNGDYNDAFAGSGNGTLDGWIGGYRFSKYTLAKSGAIYKGGVTLRDNNRWIVYAPSGVTGAGIVLPSLNDVLNALGIQMGKSFCVELTIAADLDSEPFYIYGRNALKDGDATPYDTAQIPVLTHWNNGRYDRLALNPGDCVKLLLVYEFGRSGTIDDFALTYTARLINYQA